MISLVRTGGSWKLPLRLAPLAWREPPAPVCSERWNELANEDGRELEAPVTWRELPAPAALEDGWLRFVVPLEIGNQRQVVGCDSR